MKLSMKVKTNIALFLLIYNVAFPADVKETAEKVLVYRGTSDASAAVAVSENGPGHSANMFVVADDENNVLRVYRTDATLRSSASTLRPPRRTADDGSILHSAFSAGAAAKAGTTKDESLRSTSKPGLPIFYYDLTSFLDIEPEHLEADIEGATRVAERIYWITSHGRNKDGEPRPNRYRFFATDVKIQDGNISIRPVGIPCKSLVHSLLKTISMNHLELDKVTRFDAAKLTEKERQKLAPKEHGLNIEALCASADGRTLYIGFRNPRPIRNNSLKMTASPGMGISNGTSPRDKKNDVGKALVVPLKNADAVIENSAAPIFGEPMLWSLGGLGIRSMEYSNFHQAYFIAAGPHNENPGYALYRWSGKNDEPPRFVRDLHTMQKDFTTEALVSFKNSDKLLLLSDDGSLDIKVSNASECLDGRLNDDGTCPNKFLTDPNKKTFRAIWLEP